MTAPTVAVATAPAARPATTRLPQVLLLAAGLIETRPLSCRVELVDALAEAISGAGGWPPKASSEDAELFRLALAAVAAAAGVEPVHDLVDDWAGRTAQRLVVDVLRWAASGPATTHVVRGVPALWRLTPVAGPVAQQVQDALLGGGVATLRAAGRRLGQVGGLSPAQREDRGLVLELLAAAVDRAARSGAGRSPLAAAGFGAVSA